MFFFCFFFDLVLNQISHYLQVARPAAGSSEYEICQYTIKGNPSSTQPRVQIQVKQDNPDFYEFIPGLPSPWDTTFTVVVSDTNLMFKGTFSQPVSLQVRLIF